MTFVKLQRAVFIVINAKFKTLVRACYEIRF